MLLKYNYNIFNLICFKDIQIFVLGFITIVWRMNWNEKRVKD